MGYGSHIYGIICFTLVNTVRVRINNTLQNSPSATRPECCSRAATFLGVCKATIFKLYYFKCVCKIYLIFAKQGSIYAHPLR